MTKEELLALMKERQAGISESLAPREYVMACVDAMFEVAAEALADTASVPTFVQTQERD